MCVCVLMWFVLDVDDVLLMFMCVVDDVGGSVVCGVCVYVCVVMMVVYVVVVVKVCGDVFVYEM